ncbi:hypothetical protein DNTS_028730 [Danionella cerebrum]|uniref:Uncharacterized protein n=1 Tax=Danionella cerebrum TaxID=2873325 RepID=A0A553R9I9_9TELE|nr:hypothetical protein DNTS_028730 [Danionella translucida]
MRPSALIKEPLRAATESQFHQEICHPIDSAAVSCGFALCLSSGAHSKRKAHGIHVTFAVTVHNTRDDNQFIEAVLVYNHSIMLQGETKIQLSLTFLSSMCKW